MKKAITRVLSLLLACMLALSLGIMSISADDAVPGDVNNDGELSILDALMIVKAVADGNTLENSDVNGDGKTNLLDVIKVIKLIATGTVPEVGNTESGAADVVVENGTVKEAVSINGENVSAAVPEGVTVNDGVSELTLSVTALDNTSGNITTGENDDVVSYDVHVEGVSADNTVAIVVDLGAILPVGQNFGTVSLYHVENGETVAMTQVMSLAELDEHNEFYYYPETGNVYVALATFSEIIATSDTENAWKGNFDYSWYNANKTSLSIVNADQLAAFGAIVGGMAKDEDGNAIAQDSFSGKTVKLIADINIGDTDSENGIVFYPIGYCSSDGKYEKTGVAVTTGFENFEGTFDGNGNTIANFYQNTWEMKGDNKYYDATLQYYRDGMGLFGVVYGGTVKNLTVENFSSDGEYTPTGTIAAYADCGATFENIAIFNCNPRVYNIGNGGIVGCVGWYTKAETEKKVTFSNITVDNSNKISALWGSWDVGCGGIVGQYYPTSGYSVKNAGVYFDNCHVAAQIDVYNDVCANYQYYAYRYSGMLIGSVRENVTGDDGHVYPKMDGIEAKDCTVHFGDWNDYYYCELVANSLASYTHDHQMSRLTQVAAVDDTTVTYLDGTTGTVPTSGRANYVVVNVTNDDGTFAHDTSNATCYHFVDGVQHFHDIADSDNTTVYETVDGVEVLKEDKQHIYLEFNNLFTGYGWGVTSKGVSDYEGVETDIDIDLGEIEESVEKFASVAKTTSFTTGTTVTVGELFSAVTGASVAVDTDNIMVSVSPVGDSTASGTYVANATDWTQGTVQFDGVGEATVTITDYYFCTPTVINVTVNERVPEVKFNSKFTGDFLYRVGNQNAISLGSLFEAVDGAEIGTVAVTIETVEGASGTYTAADTWTSGTIQFSGTGVVKVTITDNDYCTPTELVLEVVDAVNATTATDATANNVVLLQDCGFSSLEVSDGYALYGNGFTMTCGSDFYATDMSYSFVTLENGTLDNVQIICPDFSHAILYDSNKAEGENPSYTDSNGKTRYYNIRSAVISSGNSQILNSYISGGRAVVYATGGTLIIDNSAIVGGAASNIHTGACTLTLRNATLIQEPRTATVNDTSKTLMGLSIIAMCDGSGLCSPITLEGTFTQYAWAHEGYTEYVPSDGQSFISAVLSKEEFIHKITYPDGTIADSLNLGILFMPTGTTAAEEPVENGMIIDNRSNSENIPYSSININGSAYVYSYKNSNGTDESIAIRPNYSPNEQGYIEPSLTFSDANDARIFDTSFNATTGKWEASLKVDVDQGTYSFSFDDLIAKKYGKQLSYTVETAEGEAIDESEPITLDSAVTNEYVLTVTDDNVYDNSGIKLENTTVESQLIFKLLATKTSIAKPEWVDGKEPNGLQGDAYIVVDSKDGDWNCAVEVLKGISVRYYSNGNYEELDLGTITVNNGLLNESNNSYTHSGDDYTLVITTSEFKTNDNGKPVGVDGRLFFTVSSSSNYVSTNTVSRTIIVNYTFTDANNSEALTGSTQMTVNYSEYNSVQYKYSDFCNGTLTEASCLTPDTLVTLADGTQVRVDSLTGDEELLVWNLETGCLDSAPILFVDSESEADFEIIHLYFSDGTDVKVIYEHGFFDYDLGEYVYLDAYADKYIGHTFAKQNGDALEKVTLTDVVIEREVTTAWSPVTAGHLCYFVNGMLSMPGGVGGLFNIFDVDLDAMMYDFDAMQADIEEYGLFTYEELNAIEPLSEEMFNEAGGAYLKVSIGKGNLTIDELVAMIRRYSKFF